MSYIEQIFREPKKPGNLRDLLETSVVYGINTA